MGEEGGRERERDRKEKSEAPGVCGCVCCASANWTYAAGLIVSQPLCLSLCLLSLGAIVQSE